MQILRPISISLAVAILTAITVYIVSYLIYPISGIQVEGARMLPKTEVWQAVPDRASLITLNATLLEERLKSNPWVKSARVSRDWSSGIVTVEVEERRPILSGEMEGRKVVYAADGTEIPRLGGGNLESMALDQRRLEEILAVGKTLENNGVVIDSITGVGAHGVEALVEGRQILFAGEVGVRQARALPELMSQHPQAPRFDLRSPERIVIEDRTAGASG
ncbi:MAG: FtsQ-type POTRA domain-containing protein [Actinomycetota bacterium]|nr:FtsQ-type POTRA domain-containing protein [Actinomycetota bacterium]